MQHDTLPACPACGANAGINATLRVSFGTYYACSSCNHLWCVEAARPERDRPFSAEEMKTLRELRERLGQHKPRIH